MKQWMALPALICPALTLASCSGDDPTSPPPAPNAPEVLGTMPINGDVGVEGGQPVTIYFDRAMDPATAADAVPLSRGLITDSIRLTDKILQTEPYRP